jgi:hypothetical protein
VLTQWPPPPWLGYALVRINGEKTKWLAVGINQRTGTRRFLQFANTAL